MTETSYLKWPRNSFEPLIEYVSDFIHFNINLGSASACHQCHDVWMRRYRGEMEKWTTYDIAVWCVRCRQSLKLAFSATYLALAAKMHEIPKYSPPPITLSNIQCYRKCGQFFFFIQINLWPLLQTLLTQRLKTFFILHFRKRKIVFWSTTLRKWRRA